MKIVVAPEPVLSQKAKPFIFKKNDQELKSLLKEMEIALLSATDPKGVGLAAPQIGKSVSVFIAKPTEKSKIKVFINPLVVERKQSKAKVRKTKYKKLEGCLSLPNIWGEVKRPQSIKIEYLDEKGIKREQIFNGFMSVIVQHEIDHLEGILFPKRVFEQKGKLYKSYKNEQNEDEFEELEI